MSEKIGKEWGRDERDHFTFLRPDGDIGVCEDGEWENSNVQPRILREEEQREKEKGASEPMSDPNRVSKYAF